jgi:hypothetical protein
MIFLRKYRWHGGCDGKARDSRFQQQTELQADASSDKRK